MVNEETKQQPKKKHHDTGKLIRFTYTAMRDGETYEGTLDAPDRFAVYERIRAEGGEVISVSRAQGIFGWFKALNARFSTIKESDKIIFARNLSAMLEAGLPLSRALGAIARQTRSPKLKYVIQHLMQDVRKGSSLHDALVRHGKAFPDLFVAMVHAGEEGGTLPSALESVAQQMDKSYQLKKKVRGAMIYPGVVLSAMVLIGFLMMTQVVPTLKKTFDELGAELPPTTQAIISISDFLVNNILLSIAIIIAVVVGFITLLRTPHGKRLYHTIILRIPVIGGIAREVQAARFARTLASLLASGVSIVQALEITAEVVSNTLHKEVVLSARGIVEKGEPMSGIFNRREDLFPPLVGEMLAVGEETGEVSAMLGRVADFYEGEVEQKTKNMSTIIEPFLMLIIGAGVGFFALAMIGPIYSLSDTI